MNETDVTEKIEKNWLTEEAEKLKSQIPEDSEKLPALVLEEGKISLFEIDFTEKFRMWEDNENQNMKAMIPCIQDNVRKLFWLNIKNPLYTQLILAGQEGQRDFKVLQTGNKKNTRYTLIKE